MKKSLVLITIFLIVFQESRAQVGINTSIPDNSSILDIVSTSKGALLPRVSLLGDTDQSTINSPADGLTIFNTTTSAVNPIYGKQVMGGHYYFWWVDKWNRLLIEDDLAQLAVPEVVSILSFADGDPIATNYLSADIGSGHKQILFNLEVFDPLDLFDTSTYHFTANKTGFYEFKIQMGYQYVGVIAIPGLHRLGVSVPSFSNLPSSGVGNSHFGVLNDNRTLTSAGNLPNFISANGVMYMQAGQKVAFLSRYMDDSEFALLSSVPTLHLSFNRQDTNQVTITYFGG